MRNASRSRARETPTRSHALPSPPLDRSPRWRVRARGLGRTVGSRNRRHGSHCDCARGSEASEEARKVRTAGRAPGFRGAQARTAHAGRRCPGLRLEGMAQRRGCSRRAAALAAQAWSRRAPPARLPPAHRVPVGVSPAVAAATLMPSGDSMAQLFEAEERSHAVDDHRHAAASRRRADDQRARRVLSPAVKVGFTPRRVESVSDPPGWRRS